MHNKEDSIFNFNIFDLNDDSEIEPAKYLLNFNQLDDSKQFKS
jgi:hypothetical protein